MLEHSANILNSKSSVFIMSHREYNTVSVTDFFSVYEFYIVLTPNLCRICY